MVLSGSAAKKKRKLIHAPHPACMERITCLHGCVLIIQRNCETFTKAHNLITIINRSLISGIFREEIERTLIRFYRCKTDVKILGCAFKSSPYTIVKVDLYN